MKTWKLIICALLLAAAGACNRAERQETETDDNAGPVNLVYGIDADLYRLETSEIARGETLGKILSR